VFSSLLRFLAIIYPIFKGQCGSSNRIDLLILGNMNVWWAMRTSLSSRVVRVSIALLAFFAIKTALRWGFQLRLLPMITAAELRPGMQPAAARIIRASMLYGTSNSLYERAIRTHLQHSERWGHRFQVLREDLTSGFWNKPAYMLYSITQELVKPSRDRAEWLM